MERPILFSGSTQERFDALIMPEPNTGCWLWTGATNAKGYGRFSNAMAHRVALALSGRPVPAGLEVDHRCRVRSCVNPEHLDIVTHAENIARKTYPTICPVGHCRFSRRSDGKRACLECDRLRNQVSYRTVHPERRRSGRRWLTPAEKDEIRRLLAAGLSHSQIAPLCNVSVGTVSRVRNSHA